EKIVDGIVEQGYDSLFYVGICGTYASGMQVVNYLSGNSLIPVYLENAAELLTNTNKKFKKGAVMIFSTVTGSTEEIVNVVRLAKERGVRVFGFIDKEDVPLVGMVDDCISYPGNEQLKLFMTAHRFMYRNNEFDEYESFYEEMEQHLAKALIEVEKKADTFGLEFAKAHEKDALHYFVGAGILWGATYSYAMCYWEEMHWIRTKSIHAAEFFHGMLEIVEKDTPVTVFVGEDAERPLAERVARFLPRICANYTVIDTKEYDLPGISPKYRGFLSHLVMHAVTQRIDAHLEQVSCHPMEIRRYYRRLDY
ncbi:MAG: SIS domain-containing protein, partial [Massilimaliae sp.]|nr:SIS domain-containing protein [Massiliimalia sp.]